MQRVLIADDNSNIQKMVSLALKDAGIEVVAVNNGEAAVRKMPEVLPDLVLADIFMPVRSGYEVCEYVKRDPRFMHTPVILLAGAFDPFDEREAKRVQADGVLKKPFVPPDPLVNMVMALLSKAAGERLVPVGVAASHSAHAEVTTGTAPVREAVVEPFTDEPPEELKLPVDSLNFADDKTLAFGSLLDAPPFPIEADSVVTSTRDPVLGEPAFWAPTEASEPASDTDVTEEHALEEPVPASAEISHVRPADLDLPLDFPSLDYVPEELTEVAPETDAPPSNASPVLEWPLAEDFSAEEIKTESKIEDPAISGTSEPEPLPDWATLQGTESAGALAEHEATAYVAEELQAVISIPESKQLVTPEIEHFAVPEAEELAAPEAQAVITDPEAAEPALAEPQEPTSIEPESAAAPFVETIVETIEPAEAARSEAPPAEEMPDVDRFVEAAHSEVASAPDFSSIFALAKTDLLPAIETEIKPYAASPDLISHHDTGSGSVASLDLEPPHEAEPPSPELIEAVVARVIERMQPKMIEIVTREILRPVVEALVRREIEKK